MTLKIERSVLPLFSGASAAQIGPKKILPEFLLGGPNSREVTYYFSFPNSTNLSTSLFTDKIRTQVAVQNTGLVMQWCPLQLPSSF